MIDRLTVREISEAALRLIDDGRSETDAAALLQIGREDVCRALASRAVQFTEPDATEKAPQ